MSVFTISFLIEIVRCILRCTLCIEWHIGISLKNFNAPLNIYAANWDSCCQVRLFDTGQKGLGQSIFKIMEK